MSISKTILTAAIFLGLAGCGIPRPDMWPFKQSPEPAAHEANEGGAPANIQLPIKGELVIYMTPRDLKKRTKVAAGGGYSDYWFEEGQLIHRTATQAFGKLFERVSQGKKGTAPYPVVTIQGESSFNPIMGTSYAAVVVTFTTPQGTVLGKLEADGAADRTGEAGFQQAYDAAFKAIRAQLLQSTAMVAALSQLAGKSALAASGSPAATQAPQPMGQSGAGTSLGAKESASVAAVSPKAAAKPAPFVKPSDIRLPVKGELMVYQAPDDLERRTKVAIGGGYSEYWFEEGKTVQHAATSAFGKIFERVSPGREGPVPYPVAKIEAASSFNPVMGTYYANVAVNFFSGGGEEIGTIEAESSASGRGVDGFEKVYDAAFKDISAQLLQNGAIMGALIEGAGKPGALASATGDLSQGGKSNIRVPAKGELAVYLSARDLIRQTKVPATGGYSSYWFEEGKMVQRAAVNAFGKLFERVSPGKGDAASRAIVTVQGRSSFNPLMETYYAKVIVTFSSNSGEPIGKYEAESSANGIGVAGFEKAYDAAFQDIVNRLLKAGQL